MFFFKYLFLSIRCLTSDAHILHFGKIARTVPSSPHSTSQLTLKESSLFGG